MNAELTTKHMDVVANVNGVLYYVDVGFVTPTINPWHRSLTLLMETYENTKRKKYLGALAQLGVNSFNFIPFIICSTGLLGPAATTWLKDLSAHKGFQSELKSWHQLTCFRAATAVGKFEEESRSNLRLCA